MGKADQFFDALDAWAEREAMERLGKLIKLLPKKYSAAEKARIRAVSIHIRSCGASVDEALDVARKNSDAMPGQSVTDDIRSKFWEKPAQSQPKASS